MEQTPPGAGRPVPPAPAAGYAPPRDDGFFEALRGSGLVRTQDRWVGGVAGGIARRFGIDPLLVRGILAVTVLVGGAGLVVYGLAWALLPEERDGRIHLQETVRGRFDAALLGAVAAVVIGLNRGDGWTGWWDGRGIGWVNGLLWAAASVAVVALVVTAINGRRGPRPAVPHPGYGPVPSATAGTGAFVPPPPTTSPTATAEHAPPPPPASATGSAGSPGWAAADTGGPGGPGAPGAPAAWTGGPGTWSAGPRGWTPAPPPPPAKPRVQGPGMGAVGAVVGLTLVVLAGLLLLDREGRLAVPVGLTALGTGVVLAGLGIIVSGLRGRSSGTLGFLAVVGLVAAVPLTVLTTQTGPFRLDEANLLSVTSGSTWRPTTVAEARQGVSVDLGDVVVDLRDVPLGTGMVEVPISMGAGELEVVVPRDIAVTGDISVAAGDIAWEVDGLSRTAGVLGDRTEHFASDEASDGAADLALTVRAGAGEIRVVEEDR